MFTRIGYVGICEGLPDDPAIPARSVPSGHLIHGAFRSDFDPLGCKLFVSADISIGGNSFHTDRALFDTGATITAASSDVIRSLPDTAGLDGVALGVGGNSPSRIFAASLALPGGIHVPGIQLWVFDLPESTADMVIGMDVISMGRLIVDGQADPPFFSFRI